MNEQELYRYEKRILMSRIASLKGSLWFDGSAWMVQVGEHKLAMPEIVFEYEIDYRILRMANDFIKVKFPDA